MIRDLLVMLDLARQYEIKYKYDKTREKEYLHLKSLLDTDATTHNLLSISKYLLELEELEMGSEP
jgi:hypothetical protein